MSKLFLLISLMGFVSIKAFAMTGEEKIKENCRIQSRGYGDETINSPYQKCLRANGVVAVTRNLNGDDASKSDARLCYIGNPVCKSCFDRYGSGAASQVRTNVTKCLDADKTAKQRQADADQKKRDDEARERRRIAEEKAQKQREADALRRAQQPQMHDEVRIAVAGTCSKRTPIFCKTEQLCRTNNGQWDGTACSSVACPTGTTVDRETGEGNTCKCDADANYAIERGTTQQCPSSCQANNNMEYNMIVRSCVCKDGFEDLTGSMVTCVSKNRPAAQPQVAECLRELQDKVNSCDSSASTAIDKCDSKKKKGDTIDTLQTLLAGATKTLGAMDNCSNAAVAGSTGYYALEALRTTCDTQLGSCKSDCSDANSMLTSDKESVYQKCRQKAWDDHACAAPGRSPYRAGSMPTDEPAFNAEWDAINKAPFDQQIQQMQTKVTDSNAKCETGGTAVANRDEMTGYMGEMDKAFKSASQCECQLSSAGSNCNNIPGPADCAADPTAAGCARATINCLSATDNSKKCVCFRSPNSDECKNTATASAVLPFGASGPSAFAGAGVATETAASTVTGLASPTDASGKVSINAGDLSGSNEVARGGASGTSTTDGGSSTFGSAQGSGVGQASGGGSSGAAAKANGEGDGADSKGVRGLFEIAKGALGSLFNKKNSGDKSSTDSFGEQKFDANGNPINSRNWRPRGMVRGLAGANDEAIGGKYEDIWKVMNKQYKVQDQKDRFIFGGEKN